jgi:hypothetical protein
MRGQRPDRCVTKRRYYAAIRLRAVLRALRAFVAIF